MFIVESLASPDFSTACWFFCPDVRIRVG